MIAVFCNTSSGDNVSRVLGYKSCLELPVFDKKLFDFALMQLQGTSALYLLDNSNTASADDTPYKTVNDKELMKILFDLPFDESVVLFYSNYYTEELYDVLNYEDNIVCSVFYADKNNRIAAGIFNVQELRRRLFFYDDFKDIIEKLYTENDELITVDDYCTFIDTYEDYTNLIFDTMNKKYNFVPSYIAEGVYTEGKIPSGDYSVIPPVYIQEGVQIESGAIIGPNVKIMADTLIAKDSVIKNSIIMEDAFISSNCYLDGCVCCKGVSVKRGSVIFKNTVLGKESIIGEESVIENGAVINPSVRCDKVFKSPFGDYSEDAFIKLTVDKAALLGYVLGLSFKNQKIGILYDGDSYSQGIKFAVIGGLVTGESVCYDFGCGYLSSVFFYSYYCGVDYSIFVSNHSGVIDIKIFDKYFKPLPIYQYHNMLKKDPADVSQKNCKYVRQIFGLKKIYIRRIESLFSKEVDIKINLETSNEFISKIFGDILKKIKGGQGFSCEFNVFINDEGTSASVTSSGKHYTHNDILRILEFNNVSSEDSVNESSDYIADLWRNDTVYMIFELLALIVNNGTSIQALYKSLPGFYYMEKDVDCGLSLGCIAGKLNRHYTFDCKGKAFVFDSEKGHVEIIKKENSSKIKIKTSSLSSEYALELWGDIETILKDY